MNGFDSSTGKYLLLINNDCVGLSDFYTLPKSII